MPDTALNQLPTRASGPAAGDKTTHQGGQTPESDDNPEDCNDSHAYLGNLSPDAYVPTGADLAFLLYLSCIFHDFTSLVRRH